MSDIHTEAARKHHARHDARLPPDPPPPPPDHRGFPPPPPVCDPLPPDPRFPLNEDSPTEPVAGHFRDAGSGFLRTTDLPLYAPPVIHLAAEAESSGVRVRLVGASANISTRWEGDGVIEGTGSDVLWRPEIGPAYLRVAVRAHGGVAFACLHLSTATRTT